MSLGAWNFTSFINPLGLGNTSARSPDGPSRGGIRGLEFRVYSSTMLPLPILGVLRTRPGSDGWLHGDFSMVLTSRESVTSRAPRLMTICHIVSIGCPSQCGYGRAHKACKLMKYRQYSRTKSYVYLGCGVLYPRAAVVMNSHHDNTKREATWD